MCDHGPKIGDWHPGRWRRLLGRQVLSTSWDGRPFGHNRHGPKIEGLCPFLGELGPHLELNVAWAKAYFRIKWHFDPSRRLATIDLGRQLGAVPPFWERELGPHLTQRRLGQGLPLYHASGILIHPAVWPQHTNVTDRQDRQDNGPIAYGRTVLQTVARKRRGVNPIPRQTIKLTRGSGTDPWPQNNLVFSKAIRASLILSTWP